MTDTDKLRDLWNDYTSGSDGQTQSDRTKFFTALALVDQELELNHKMWLHWCERAELAESELKRVREEAQKDYDDMRRFQREFIRSDQENEMRKEIINKRNYHIKQQKKEIIDLKGRITVLKKYGYDPKDIPTPKPRLWDTVDFRGGESAGT